METGGGAGTEAGSSLALLLRALGTGTPDGKGVQGVLARGTCSGKSFKPTSQPSLSQVVLDPNEFSRGFLVVLWNLPSDASGAVQVPDTESSPCFPSFDVAPLLPPAGTNSVGVVARENVCGT